MAQAKSAKRKPAKKKGKAPLLPAGAREFLTRQAWRLLGLALLGVFVAAALMLISFDPADPTLNQATDRAVGNWLGRPGAIAADILLQTVGLAAVALIAPLAGWGWRVLSLKGLPFFWTHLLILPASVMAWSILAATFAPPAAWPVYAGFGGMLGQFLLRQLEEVMAAFDLIVPLIAYRAMFAALAVVCLMATLGISRAEWARLGRGLWHGLAATGKGLVRAVVALLRRDKTGRGTPQAKRRGGRAKAPARTAGGQKRVKGPKKTTPGRRDAEERQGSLFGALEGSNFKLPPLDLLNRAERAPGDALSSEALEQNARLLESVLDDFGIQGEIINVRPGPVVTLYELEPAPGTKSARVIGLADDIARSMSAVSARVAVIPGRNAIGIELPNSRRETVALREILASRAFENAQARLPLVLGKAIGGEPVIVDLASMPHLLVAGTTGSGKSVGLNTMILSLIYRLPPDECRLILVDPKMLELSVYEDIPHLLHPVVTEPKKAVVALKWAVREMEERYRAMSKIGVRSITAYNKRVAEARASGKPLKRKVQTGFDGETGEPVYEEQEFDLQPFPQIVIVIDEMADLMLVAGKDVEATVQRLAQMARAAGLHVIMATQRPSVDVITGTIKANFPTRVSYQVTSKVDSRTILGEQGAEQLLGQGDMLFMAGGGRISRVHGAFVTDQEVEAVVDYLKRQGAPDYVQAVTEEPEEGFDSPFIPGPLDEDKEASLYDQAVDIVQRDRRASTSYIQRRLKIGYNRAASLIEQMEDDGVVSAPNHAGKREVLVPERD